MSAPISKSATTPCELSQTFWFDAAHTLDRKLETEGSRRIHGHTYHAEVILRGPIDPATGMLVDLGIVRREVQLVRDALDHRFLDEVDGLGRPTLENLCLFIARLLKPRLPQLAAVTVRREAIGDRCTIDVQ